VSERQDIYSGQGIGWRWVGVGVLIVLGTQSLIGAVLAAFGFEVATLGAFVVVTSLGFFTGGAVVGLLSPGYTAWEAGFASVIAAVGTVFLAARLLEFGAGLVAIVPIAVGWGLLCGLAGGFLGERLQASNHDRPG
jgi:hypothetical protein